MERRCLTISDMEYCRPCENPTLLGVFGANKEIGKAFPIQALVALVLLVLGVSCAADPLAGACHWVQS